MTRILVLGGTGPTGQLVIAQALERGHEVTAFTRSPAKFATRTADRICVLRGALPDDAKALSEALRGQDAVISTLGTGTSLKPEGLIARIMPVLVEAMQGRGLARLVFTSAYGVGETIRDVPLLSRTLIGLLLKEIYADKAAGEEVLRRSSLDWTLVYPVTLTNGPRKGGYRIGERLTLRGLPRISRADLADCLLTLVEAGTFVRRGVLVAS
ncbi:MAG: NAD(P)-dependent oxidoreductase [Gemmatimonadales bacterium]